MAYTSDRTGASIDQVLDDADAGNIGKSTPIGYSANLDDLTIIGDFNIASTATNRPPIGSSGGTLHVSLISSNFVSQIFIKPSASVVDVEIYVRTKSSTWSDWVEIYHTSNTGVLGFTTTVPAINDIAVNIRDGDGRIDISNEITGATNVMAFYNPNGTTGNIQTSGSSTAYNTSSDPRLKEFKDAPTDDAINSKFNSLFDAFATFNWKSDPEGDLVWGFNAHKCIDNGLDIGTEGDGPRNLSIGDVYEIIPAEFDEEGSEIKSEKELKVAPASVDQSKAVPILLAKLEQLERRIKELEA